MGSEFVKRKSSGSFNKKSDTKPSLFTSCSFSAPTPQNNKVSKKELPKEIPQPDYILARFLDSSTAPVQRQEDSENEQQEESEVDLKSNG